LGADVFTRPTPPQPPFPHGDPLRELAIDGSLISDSSECYVIAEIGHNHQGDLAKCKEMFDAARWAGCSAVKLQKRDNRTLYTEEAYNAPYNSENAFGPTYGAHREALEFSVYQYVDLQAYAKKLGITFFATAFDIPSVNVLLEIDVPAIKIASGDLTNLGLLRHVATLGKPVILSTGGAPRGMRDVLAARKLFDEHCAVLQCTSGYPASYNELDLKVIESYRALMWDSVIGWSAHDTGIAMAPVAYALGARIIEKHFTLDRSWKGTDQAFSLEPQGMRTMIENLKHCREALGDGVKRAYESEAEPLKKQLKNADGRIGL
jgi:sialic acid synthase